MKKILTILVLMFICLLSLPSYVFAETGTIVTINKATGINSNVHVSGTTDKNTTAVAIQVLDDGDNVVSMYTAPVNDKNFSTNFYVDLETGKEYTVRVANYSGGPWDTMDFVAITASGDSSVNLKDETCEAVIGPRWRWNAAKGVCEEYAVVKTDTK